MEQETNLENLSTDEIKALKKKRVSFMSESLKDLRIQDEYSRLKANISENTLRDTMAKMKLATLKAPAPKEEEGEKVPEKSKG